MVNLYDYNGRLVHLRALSVPPFHPFHVPWIGPWIHAVLTMTPLNSWLHAGGWYHHRPRHSRQPGAWLRGAQVEFLHGALGWWGSVNISGSAPHQILHQLVVAVEHTAVHLDQIANSMKPLRARVFPYDSWGSGSSKGNLTWCSQTHLPAAFCHQLSCPSWPTEHQLSNLDGLDGTHGWHASPRTCGRSPVRPPPGTSNHIPAAEGAGAKPLSPRLRFARSSIKLLAALVQAPHRLVNGLDYATDHAEFTI